ncbi:MAG TPA: AAA family ATPase [Lacipirellula sp.]
MPTDEFPQILAQFRQSLAECRDLYRSSGELAIREQSHRIKHTPAEFVELMDDLHRALVVKIFVKTGQCDRAFSRNEQALAAELIEHLWNKRLEGDQLRAAIVELADNALKLKWYSLYRPFDEIAPLRNRIGELEALVIRLANFVARADGAMKSVEAATIKSIQEELYRHLRPIPIDEADQHAAADRAGSEAVEKTFDAADQLPARKGMSAAVTGNAIPSNKDAAAAQPTLEEALAELDSLIGLENVKHEVRTLANFLKVQAQRAKAGLPATPLSLHMVFGGNPGTGKTSVARIVGKVFGAMGILKRGHLVETDRSGLVAEYAGQTGPKTHKKIDEALDGVLFIDEAYTLIHAEGDDPYGHEAVQTLLKRMEDNRDRLVVILAGYPAEMEALLESNPGLTSRFSRHLDFPDYTPLELACIFATMCDRGRYRLDCQTRAKVMLGLTWLFENRDEHFGNGRTVRNIFEHSIRCQANRIAEITRLTVEELSTLTADDVQFEDCPAECFARLNDASLRFEIACEHCQHADDAKIAFLGAAVRCPKCKKEFTAHWGAPI